MRDAIKDICRVDAKMVYKNRIVLKELHATRGNARRGKLNAKGREEKKKEGTRRYLPSSSYGDGDRLVIYTTAAAGSVLKISALPAPDGFQYFSHARALLFRF